MHCTAARDSIADFDSTHRVSSQANSSASQLTAELEQARALAADEQRRRQESDEMLLRSQEMISEAEARLLRKR